MACGLPGAGIGPVDLRRPVRQRIRVKFLGAVLGMTASLQSDQSARRLIDAKETGRKLGCSWRTVLRLADSGRIPAGYKLGALRRWDAAELDAFIANGCKP